MSPVVVIIMLLYIYLSCLNECVSVLVTFGDRYFSDRSVLFMVFCTNSELLCYNLNGRFVRLTAKCRLCFIEVFLTNLIIEDKVHPQLFYCHDKSQTRVYRPWHVGRNYDLSPLTFTALHKHADVKFYCNIVTRLFKVNTLFNPSIGYHPHSQRWDSSIPCSTWPSPRLTPSTYT